MPPREYALSEGTLTLQAAALNAEVAAARGRSGEDVTSSLNKLQRGLTDDSLAVRGLVYALVASREASLGRSYFHALQHGVLQLRKAKAEESVLLRASLCVAAGLLMRALWPNASSGPASTLTGPQVADTMREAALLLEAPLPANAACRPPDLDAEEALWQLSATPASTRVNWLSSNMLWRVS